VDFVYLRKVLGIKFNLSVSFHHLVVKGIHGEPGSSRTSLLPSRELVRRMLEMIISKTDPDRSYLDVQENRDSVVLLVNNLGATSGLECGVVLNDALLYLSTLRQISCPVTDYAWYLK